MNKITFIHPDGKEQVCEAPDGLSVLEVAHRNMIDLEGACEGSMACSTCHVIVDDAWYAKLDEPEEEEEDMLDLTFGLKRTSRLGCQIRMSDNLDGLIVKLPAEHRNLV
ncbi:2Fe-2S iron-sulfur cluster-binding protein [Rhodospirillales bacterium]|nr:2Fe-2S iron-sulfur cluster-binding protein [Rhodospirillales bacterium]